MTIKPEVGKLVIYLVLNWSKKINAIHKMKLIKKNISYYCFSILRISLSDL